MQKMIKFQKTFLFDEYLYRGGALINFFSLPDNCYIKMVMIIYKILKKCMYILI